MASKVERDEGFEMVGVRVNRCIVCVLTKPPQRYQESLLRQPLLNYFPSYVV